MTTLLAIGDMHLGRPAPALPEDLRERHSELGPEAAWIRAVDTALAYGVDAVLLAGDLIDRERDFFFAYGELRAGVERLSNAGIPVLAVAGNHDTETLPRLADEIDSLELIGANGRWQLRQFDGLGIVGWSFPRPQVRSNPLDSLPTLDLPTSKIATTIGLLHCDLDQTDSPYAPVARRDLEAAPIDSWLLGHIHRPDPLSSERPIGYLGSITALRASETGARGPWLIEVSPRRLSFEHLPLAPLRFEALDVDCSELEDAAALDQTVLKAIKQRLGEIDLDDQGPVAIGWRITLSGQSPAAGQLAAAAAELAADNRSWQEAGLRCFIQRIESIALPRLDLKRLAGQDDPSGLLARRLLALDDPESEEFDRLIRLGQQALSTPLAAPEFQALDRRLEEADIADWLRRSGRRALLLMLAQREAGR